MPKVLMAAKNQFSMTAVKSLSCRSRRGPPTLSWTLRLGRRATALAIMRRRVVGRLR